MKKIIQKVKNKGIFFLTSKNINWKKFKEKKIFSDKNHSWFDIKDIEFCLKKLKVKVLKKGGFIPNKNRIVEINCSHSFFIIAKKNI